MRLHFACHFGRSQRAETFLVMPLHQRLRTHHEGEMEIPKFVSVLIVDQAIEAKGVLANAAFVLGLTAGRELAQETFGPDVVDGEGTTHRSLTRIGHFVRKAGQNKMRNLRKEFAKDPRVLVIDYAEDAAPADYDTYSRDLSQHSGEQIKYRALYAYGPADIVVPLTKNLSHLE